MDADSDVSAHRVRSNRWPEPIGYDGQGAPLYPWQQTVPAPRVEAVYEPLEDKQ